MTDTPVTVSLTQVVARVWAFMKTKKTLNSVLKNTMSFEYLATIGAGRPGA